MERSFCTISHYPQAMNHMDESVVQKLINNYLRILGISDYHLEKIESKGEKFEVRTISKDGFIMDRTLVVDKHTGWVQFVPRIN